MKKQDFYIVIDTPKKAKRLKEVLDMFGEEIGKITVGWKIEHYAKYGWVSSSVCHDKTKVSIKQLKKILANEHLKPNDVVICNGNYTDLEYIVRIKEVKDNNIYSDKFYVNNEVVNNLDSCKISLFKRYATPEEIALLEPKEEKKELEVGKWYKYEYPCNGINGYLLFNFNGKISEHSQYGFIHTSRGNLFTDDISIYEDNISKYTEATHQEVESALIEEFNRRYKFGDSIQLVNGSFLIIGDVLKLSYITQYNYLFLKNEYKDKRTLVIVFNNGKWAEVDKFAELKEAHKNGAVIEVFTKLGWIKNSIPLWKDNREYRIKTEEKPKVGDWVSYKSGDIRKVTEITIGNLDHYLKRPCGIIKDTLLINKLNNI